MQEQTVKKLAPALYVTATPIGNMADITLRALQTLQGVDMIACEDTRTTRKLLDKYQISTVNKKLISYVEAKASSAASSSPSFNNIMGNQIFNLRHFDTIVRAIREHGQSVALCSECGTPVISDPGANLIKCCYENGIQVVPIPGPSAIIAAISVCGLNVVDRFAFEGFLSANAKLRAKRLLELARVEQYELQLCSKQGEEVDDKKSEPSVEGNYFTRSIVFYESPERISLLLADLITIFGTERRACVAREITKVFEEVQQGTLGQLLNNYFPSNKKHLGEFTVILEGTNKFGIGSFGTSDSSSRPSAEKVVSKAAKKKNKKD